MDFDDLSDKQKVQVAKGFDATPELIPFIPFLLQDLWELGSSPKIIIDILKSIELVQPCRVLDLACGKGAVSCKIAQELGYQTHGIDLFKPFIEEAKIKAKEFGVADLCKFEVGDINTVVQTKKNFDVVVLAAAESLLGTIDTAIQLLRQCVKSNGYIIYDGVFLNEGSVINKPEYSIIRSYEETIRLLTSHYDKIIMEVRIPIEETKAINDSFTVFIKKRANELLTKFPERKDMLIGYVKEQEEECKIIENDVVGCVWCIQKL